MCNQEDKENTGYEIDNTNVAVNPLILFHCSGKECRLQEPSEFPESANIWSSTSVYINKEFSKPATSIYSVETTYGINSVISKLTTFVENAETGQF
jgi:hypothetical protein